MDRIQNVGIEHLWIGSVNCIKDRIIIDNNINAVISVTKTYNVEYPIRYLEMVVNYTEFADEDGQNVSYVSNIINPIIHSLLCSKKNVLVVCGMGESRSSCIVLSYMIQMLNMTYNDAFELLQKHHSIACPRQYFCDELKKLEKTVNGSNGRGVTFNKINS